jgi:cystathionine gamma-synthase
MAAHPKVAREPYPGLPSFSGHVLAKSMMDGFGGVDSLVTQPCTTTHHGLTPGERSRRGISDAMLRLSIGLEDADDLIADLNEVLA